MKGGSHGMRERTKKETKTQVSPEYWLGERVYIKEPEDELDPINKYQPIVIGFHKQGE
jgi:hypothetical protein